MSLWLRGVTNLTAKEKNEILKKTKEYLSQVTDVDLRIDSLKISIQKCRERAEKITSTFSDIPFQNNGSTSDKVGDNVAEMIDYEKQAYELINQAQRLRIQIISQINEVKNNIYFSLLTDKYISNLTWEETAEQLDKDYIYTKGALHDKAVLEFSKIILKK